MLLCLAVMPVASMETKASSQVHMFPALRKRLTQQKLAAAQQHTETVQAQGPVEDSASLPEENETPAAVPAAVDTGSGEFPQLPAVSQILSGASGTLKSVSSQASSLQARVVQAQMQSESKLSKQKAAFEEKLKSQEQSNRAIVQENDNITAEIKRLQGSNVDMKKHAQDVEQNNKLMRSELQQLQSHLGTAEDFSRKSLISTDDHKNALLEVIHGNVHRQHKVLVQTASKTHKGKHDGDDEGSDSDEKGSDGDDDDESDSDDKDNSNDKADDDESDSDGSDFPATSFLAVSKSRRASKAKDAVSSFAFEAAMTDLETTVPAVTSAEPGDLLGDLMKDVAHLAEQEKQSVNTLKSLFIRDFRAGAKRRDALHAQQKALSATRSSLLEIQAELKTAEGHLEATQQHLQTRLHGLGQFLQKLAHVAMAQQQDAKKLMDNLPKAVTLKEKVA